MLNFDLYNNHIRFIILVYQKMLPFVCDMFPLANVISLRFSREISAFGTSTCDAVGIIENT